MCERSQKLLLLNLLARSEWECGGYSSSASLWLVPWDLLSTTSPGLGQSRNHAEAQN